MRRSLLAVLAGIILAIAAATALALVTGLPFVDQRQGETGLGRFARTLLPIAAYALPGALAAIALSEARRVRGLIYFLFVGVVIAALGFIALTGFSSPSRAAFQSMPAFVSFMLMGLAAGTAYWMTAGKHAGRLAADLARAHDGSFDEPEARRRCWSCAALWLLLGLIPLGLLGWYAIDRQTPRLASAFAAQDITAKAEADAAQWLKTAGMPWAKLRIDNHVGHVTGSATDVFTRTAAFDKAKSVLVPLTGRPGVVAYLQNDITAPDLIGSAEMVSAEKRKAEDDTTRLKAADKATADTRKKNEDTAGLATTAKLKRKAAEAAAKAKAEDQARLVAEAEAKRKAAAIAAAAQAQAKAKAEEEQRITAEAEDERKAVDAARKAVADEEARRKAVAVAEPGKPAAPAVAPSPPSPPPQTAQCATDFSDLFRSDTLRFRLRSAKVSGGSAVFLDKLAVLAKRCAGFALAIEGHADRTGNEAVNAVVSLARAEAVRNAIIARGITGDRLLAKGFGAARPFDPANTRAAYRLNRRVDFGISAFTPPPAPAAKAPPQPFAAGQCAPEFSRLFLRDAVRFGGNSAGLNDDHAEVIGKIADLALKCPSFTIYLDGHTDRRGNAASNQRLSLARAEAVRDALVDRDVPESQLVVRGYGGGRPFDPGNTAAAFALNRRIDFGIAEKSSKTP